jgi:hypothetical protein
VDEPGAPRERGWEEGSGVRWLAAACRATCGACSVICRRAAERNVCGPF